MSFIYGRRGKEKAMNTKAKTNSVLVKLQKMFTFTPSKLLGSYIFVLVLTPIAFGMYVELVSVYAKTSPLVLIKQNPTITLAVITSLIDLMLGYHLFLHKKDFLNKSSFKFLMLTQMIGQALVANFMCAILAVICLLNASSLTVKVESKLVKQNKFIATAGLAGLFLCSLLLLLIKFR